MAEASSAAPGKQTLLEAIEDRKDELVQLCQDLIWTESPNPPGDCREAAAFVERLIRERGLDVERYALNEHEPNLVARIGEPDAKPHLSVCGHLDTFHVESEELWSTEPYG